MNEIRWNTNRYKNSFYPDSVHCWNNIGSLLRKSVTLKKFKANILALVRPSCKTIFEIHNKVGIKRIYQLRVGLSPLHDHKWKHNFKDISSNKCDICNLPETIEHYFLHCTRFENERRKLFDYIFTLDITNFDQLKSEIKTKLLLYGDMSFNDLVNKSLIEAAIRFIDDTERFI